MALSDLQALTSKDTKVELTKPSNSPFKAPVSAAPPTDTSKKDGGFFSALSESPEDQQARLRAQHPLLFNPVTDFLAGTAKAIGDAGVGAIKSITETPVQFVKSSVGSAAQLPSDIQSYATQKPAEETAARKFGEDVIKPSEIPIIGEVKTPSAVPSDVENLGAQSAGEDLTQAADIYLTGGAPGAAEALGKGFQGVKKVLDSTGVTSKVSEALPKIASELTSTPARQFEAAANPEMAQTIKKVRQSGLDLTNPQDVLGIGEDVYGKAQKAIDEAKAAYSDTRAGLVNANEGKIIQRSKDFVTGVQQVLKDAKVKITPEGVDTVGSQFEGNAAAKAFLDRANGIMTRALTKGSTAVDDLLTRREAISSILDEVPFEQKNLRRVLGNMRSAFDNTLEDVIGTGAREMRKAYAVTMDAAKPIVDAMTVEQNGRQIFSPDRAAAFIKQASSDLKFDKRAMLSELDKLTGTNFTQNVQAMGLDKALSRLDPPTAGRAFDIVKGYIAAVPGLGRISSALFSPKLWGEIAIRQGLKGTEAVTTAAKNANEFRKLIISNLLSIPFKNYSSPSDVEGETDTGE